MNPVELLLRAEALQTGRARPRRLWRHVHLEAAPLAIAAVQMAGEPFALWGALVGTDATHPRVIVAPEPRNRAIVFQALAELGDALCAAVDRAAAAPRVEVPRKDQDPFLQCSTAPQLLVANRAAAELLDRLGRRMRPAGLHGSFLVPPVVPVAGGHLGFYGESARYPGSALVLVATEELARQAVTGQSSLEDAHLGAQLAWWDPALLERIQPGLLGGRAAATLGGAEAAALVEGIPMAVLTDPTHDLHQLVPAVERFNRARAGATDPQALRPLQGELTHLLTESLRPTWNALWEAHRLLAATPEAPGAARRWQGDLYRFTRHGDYLAEGGRIASVHSARRAALLLADWERAQAAVERDEVLEDPLALAAVLAAGQAIEGIVDEVNLSHREPSATSSQQVSRPLVTLRSPDPCPFPVGSELWWTARPGNVRVEVQAADTRAGGDGDGDGARIVLKVVGGMRGELPQEGTRAVFSLYTTTWVPPPPLPDQVPWTHVPDSSSSADDAVDLDDPAERVELPTPTPAPAAAS